MIDTSANAAAEPPWLAAARAELGVAEQPGSADNARVLAYYRDAGHPDIYHDSVAWCAAFACAMLERSDVTSPRSLRARSFLDWGAPLSNPVPGCLVVLWRVAPSSNSGHVGFYAGMRGDRILVLGGNQSDQVSIAAFPLSQILGYRWPTETSDPHGLKPAPDSSATFSAALAHVLVMEGGWSDDPHDPGGPTNKGITLRELAAWVGIEVTAETLPDLRTRLRAIDRATLEAIYRANYWEPALCADLSPPLALFHFDCAVNQGVARAAQFLQSALGVEVDGEIGPVTLAAAAAAHPAALLDTYADLRRTHYRSLHHFWRFGRGWLARVDATRSAALRHSNSSPSPQPKEKPMTTNSQPGTKWWGHSMTIWGVAVTTLTTVLPLVARGFGIDLPAAIVQDLGSQLTTLFQAFGGIAGILMTIFGRVRATQPLNLGPGPLRIRDWRRE